MSAPTAHQLSKIIHIASPAEAIIMGPGISDSCWSLSPRLSSILRSVMIALVDGGKWSTRPYCDSLNSYVYERRETI